MLVPLYQKENKSEFLYSSYRWWTFILDQLNGLLDCGELLRPCLSVDSSTIDPHTSRKLSLAVAERPLRQKKGAVYELIAI